PKGILWILLPWSGGVSRVAKGADCKSAASWLRRFESCLPHQRFNESVANRRGHNAAHPFTHDQLVRGAIGRAKLKARLAEGPKNFVSAKALGIIGTRARTRRR